MSDEPQKTIWEGAFEVMGHRLRCYVLEDGTRIIHADDMNDFFQGGVTINASDPEFAEFLAWSKGK